MSIDQRIAIAAEQLEADVELTHKVTHGDENTEVPTLGGPIPSLRKRLKDIETEWAKTADPLAEDLAEAVTLTRGYKDDAAASATAAAEELPKVREEGARQIQAVIDEGEIQLGRVQNSGDQQTRRVTEEGDIQTERAAGEADRSEQAASHSQQFSSDSATSATASAGSAESSATSSQLSGEHSQGAEQAQAGAETASSEARASADESAEILKAMNTVVIPMVTNLIRTQAIVVQHHAFK